MVFKMIRIESERVVPANGIKSRKIKKITGVIAVGDLPAEYRAGLYMDRSNFGTERIHIYGSREADGLVEKETYNEEYFQRNLALIKECGEKLHEINQRMGALREAWNGDETFII